MKTIIAKSLLNSYSYSGYRKIVSDLLLEGKSSGNDQSEALTNYSTLNETRMNRLEKTILVPLEIQQKLESLKNEYIWVVIAEGWCGDAAQLLPIFHKMASVSNKIEVKIVFRDENEDLMNQFLTNGSKSIPKLIVLDKNTLNVEGNWGPRPKGATELIKNYKAEFGLVDETAKTELQLWYLHDKGLSTQLELVTLMLDLEE
ncbi:thioredoxin family protein [Flavobacterium sp. GT3R68]|uniref:thioredoxin family protein n=1 Tax=Flavobacterium sp. GT3R68 TaxID=2594437 RepID=UPI000F8975E7|nr:thioredoxin family protein [Flavobacterium sp. GT3R68]RTY91318.1 thioredoxin family protein [Flavobacterium sp. GSN2]TRW93944.1 thioredoxin family protein [Flavobacterium sp. GT3R68]